MFIVAVVIGFFLVIGFVVGGEGEKIRIFLGYKIICRHDGLILWIAKHSISISFGWAFLFFIGLNLWPRVLALCYLSVYSEVLLLPYSLFVSLSVSKTVFLLFLDSYFTNIDLLSSNPLKCIRLFMECEKVFCVGLFFLFLPSCMFPYSLSFNVFLFWDKFFCMVGWFHSEFCV